MVLAGLVVGGVAYLLFRSNANATTPVIVPPPQSTRPGDLYTGSDLGPFKALTALPLVGQAYGVLAPVNDKILQPTVVAIKRGIVNPINQTLGFSKPTTTVNPDGTITRKAPDSWYTRNVGSPISHAGTAVVHFVGGLF